MIEITPKKLYIIGIFCFSIIGIANLYSFFQFFAATTIANKVASMGGIIFNFAMVGLFYYLLSMEPQITTVAESDDIDEIIKEVSKKSEK